MTNLIQEIGSPIAYYLDLVPLVGSHEAALFLCQLIYWYGKQGNPDGWICKTQEEWFLETNLTEKQQKTCRKLLVSRGFIEERYHGTPRRLEYRLKEEYFNEIWDAWMIVAKIKAEMLQLTQTYDILLSHGVEAEDIQAQIEILRRVIQQCYDILHKFFEQCRADKTSPFRMLDKLKSSLSKMAETIEK